MVNLELTITEANGLAKILIDKAKEIYFWSHVTNSNLRDKEYIRVTTLLKKLAEAQGEK